jgi:hypothetical protein
LVEPTVVDARLRIALGVRQKAKVKVGLMYRSMLKSKIHRARVTQGLVRPTPE